MARAIASRSIIEVQRCISFNPESVKDRVQGYSALQLSAAWPEGVRILLTTEARNFVHDDTGGSWYWPTSIALKSHCEESLDILINAGARLDLEFHWVKTSRGCAVIVARGLFERRAKLFALAYDELQDFEDEFTCDTPEWKAKSVYDALVDAVITVDPALNVENDLATVFHCPTLPLDYFQIFFENGFRNHWAYDKLGLTAAMLWRTRYCSGETELRMDDEDWLTALQWLQQEGFLYHSPEDPCNLGLNTKSTGWHYLAALASLRAYSDSAKITMKELSRSSARDCCVCWCMLEGEGCSPLGSIFKAHADVDWSLLGLSWTNNPSAELLYDLACGNEISNIMAPCLRFLTFEALEMTHTCCYFAVLDRDSLKCVTSDDGRPDYTKVGFDNALVILDRDTSTILETRTDEAEQRNSALLNSLMEELNSQLDEVEPTMDNFVNFLKGDWRSRIERLFTVDEEIVNGMRERLSDVKTRKCSKSANLMVSNLERRCVA